MRLCVRVERDRRLVVDILGAVAIQHGLERLLKLAYRSRTLRREVILLIRILREIEELRPRSRDVVESSVPKRFQIAPTIVIPRIERLAIGHQPQVVYLTGYEFHQALALYWRRDLRYQKLEERRHDIDDPHLSGHAPTSEVPRRQFHDEGNVRRDIVDEITVSGLAMLPETFPVIAEQCDDRRVGEPSLLEP